MTDSVAGYHLAVLVSSSSLCFWFWWTPSSDPSPSQLLLPLLLARLLSAPSGHIVFPHNASASSLFLNVPVTVLFAYLNRWFAFSGITELVNNVLQPQEKSKNDKEPEPDA